MRAHRNVPRQLVFPIRNMYLEAIDRAADHIYLTAAYFIPDHDILQALKEARARGVDVRILVPEVSNHVVADWLSRGFYGELLRSGVRIFRYHDAMVHAKTATIDGRWSTVGTANIDRLSLTGNYEINLEILDDDLAEAPRDGVRERPRPGRRADPRRVGEPRVTASVRKLRAPCEHDSLARAAPPLCSERDRSAYEPSVRDHLARPRRRRDHASQRGGGRHGGQLRRRAPRPPACSGRHP